MQILNWMTPNPTCVSPEDTLQKSRELMTAGGFRRLPVVEGDNRLAGMISERDVRQHLGYLAQTRVNAAMASRPISIPESETAESAAKLMLQHKIGGLPVTNEGRVVGIVTTTDLLKALLNVVQAAGDILKQ
jgi:acetoin utilization protein AcuB